MMIIKVIGCDDVSGGSVCGGSVCGGHEAGELGSYTLAAAGDDRGATVTRPSLMTRFWMSSRGHMLHFITRSGSTEPTTTKLSKEYTDSEDQGTDPVHELVDGCLSLGRGCDG